MDDIKLTKKQSRLRKQNKKKIAKSSGTLSGQVSRTRTAKGYLKRKVTNNQLASFCLLRLLYLLC